MTTLSIDSQVVMPVRRIVDSHRVNVLPRHFGRHMLLAESAVFDWAYALSRQYRGGFWQFYEFGQGGFYMAPDVEPFLLVASPNGFEGQLGSDAFGITCCLFGFSHLSFKFPDAAFASHYHSLRNLAMEHAEARMIAQVID